MAICAHSSSIDSLVSWERSFYSCFVVVESLSRSMLNTRTNDL